MDIEGISEKTIKKLIDDSQLKNAGDLYTLQVYDVIDLGTTRAPNLIKAIQESKKIPFPRVLYAIGIAHVGLENAMILAEHFKSIENIKKATVQDLQMIDSVGDVIAKSVVDWFRDEDNLQMIETMKKAGVQFEIEEKQEEEAEKKESTNVKAKEFFNGKKFVITGSFKDYDRVELGELIESFGAKSAPGVTSKVDYLIVGDAPGASKVAAAKKHNVKNLTEEELMSIIKE